jgi:hypothetical protein
MFLVAAGPALAAEPVVCASGSGNVNIFDFDLSTCGAPAGQPVYVELVITGGGRGQLTEGGLSCDITAPPNGTNTCAVTVKDGKVDNFKTLTNPENYRLQARWDGYFGGYWGTGNIYTSTILSSGDSIVIERRFSYGDIAVAGLLFFGCLLAMMSLLTPIVFMDDRIYLSLDKK